MLLWFILAVICGTIPSIVPIDCPTEYEQVKKDLMALQNEVAVLKDKTQKVSAFTAKLSGNVTTTDKGVIAFKNVKINEGNDYDPSTGKFTCRVPGLYFFNGKLVTMYGTDAVFHIKRGRGNVEVARPYTGGAGNWQTGSDLGFVHLNKDDEVYAYNEYGFTNLNHYSTFSGALIKAD